MAEDNEVQLEQRLAEVHGEYMQVLNDLAVIKLNKGQVDAAQQLFARLASLKAPGLSVSTAPLPKPSTPPSTVCGQQELQLDNDNGDDSSWEHKDWDAVVAPSSQAGDESWASAVGSDSENFTTINREAQPAVSSRLQPSYHTAAPQNAQAPQADITSQHDPVPQVVWEGGFDHCVEVCGLTTEVRTSHLQELLDCIFPGVRLQPYIRWADDQHAVFVCPDTSTAQLLIEAGPDYGYHIQPFSEACQASKQLPTSDLLPPKPRPKTTATVARKLLSHALGMPSLRDRAGERELAAARKEKKEQRAAQRAAVTSAWGDDDP